ncbi:MAG: domain containing protein, partial [Flavipsychrobacter sp.]|nr:domain containing protein [Flavipsychrobacter sp.]
MYRIFAKRAVYSLLFLLPLTLSTSAQIAITANQTAAALVQQLVGNGVIVSGATLTCPQQANGVFTTTGVSNLGIDSGIILTSGRAATNTGGTGGNGSAGLFAATSNNTGGDAQLSALAGQNTFDACILEFDFMPSGDTIKFNYVFSSEEYFGYSCTVFNDVFGFFLSGPGITGSKNLAVVPNTNIPVTVNSTTNPLYTTPGSLTMCQAMGTGSPFSQYFVNNSSGNYVTHDGFTTVFTAKSAVIPCSTYHLKLAIADGADGTLDSGTWIEAGSLTSNAIKIKPIGGAGLSQPRPYAVRGCLPGQFVFNRPSATSQPLTIKYQITGTAINGTDYLLIPDSVVILGGATQASRTINAVPITPAAGLRTVKLRLYNPYSCGAPQVIDSAELDIYDSLFVKILTNDTAICVGNTINLDAIGDNILTFKWIPNSVADPTSLHTTASPGVSTFYTIEASLPGSGCPPAHDNVQVHVRYTPTVDVGPDVTTCLGTAVQLNTNSTPGGQPYTYSWSPAAGLSSATVRDPLANPTATTTYTVTVNPGAIGCDGTDDIKVTVLPNDFTLGNKDTAICKGEKVVIHGAGAPEFTYVWTPVKGVKIANQLLTEIKPDTTTDYWITATYPGCPDMKHHFVIDVQPIPTIYAGADREMCQWDTVHLHATVAPGWYNYNLSWKPASAIMRGEKEKDAIFASDFTTDMVFIASTAIGCADSDIVKVVVHPGNFASIQPEGPWGICPNDSIHFTATGGVKYDWFPNTFISAPDKSNVTVYPTAKTVYTLYVTDEHTCRDTIVMPVVVYPEAIAQLGDDITLHPGQSHQMEPKGNALYFDWFPRVGLS